MIAVRSCRRDSTRQSRSSSVVVEIGDPEHHLPAVRGARQEARRFAEPGAADARARPRSTSRSRRSRCVRPRAGGTKCSTVAPTSSSPTRSLLRIAAKPRIAHSSAASSRFSTPGGAEAHRARHVHHQHHRQLALLDEALDVRSAESRAHVPVDVAHFVAGHVVADFLELDAAPLEDALRLAREQILDQVAAADLESPDLAQQFRGLHQGTRTCSRMRRATSSPSMPSASASYETWMRWRSTSGAMPLTSSGST